ncbi:MAG: hypothetical protein AAGC77_09160 [Pseudomonadota bacterium]
MTTRRTFLKVGAGATGFYSLGGAFANPAPASSPDFIVLERSLLGGDMAAHRIFGGAGATILQFDADPMRLWEQSILPAIAHAPVTIAGLTFGHAAFSLSEIARDYGLILTRSQALDSDQRETICLDAVSLNQPIQVAWTMEPKGIKFR